jgi:hypothetical protein
VISILLVSEKNLPESKLGNVEIFSKEFVAYNKCKLILIVGSLLQLLAREADLRNLRRKISTVEEKIEEMNERIDALKEKLDNSYRSMPPAKRVAFEKERQLMLWCRELVCQLDKAGLMEELNLSYNSPEERVIQAIEESLSNPTLGPKIKKLFSGFVLEIF